MSVRMPADSRGQAVQVLTLKGYAKVTANTSAANLVVTDKHVGYLVSDIALNFIYDGTAVAGDDAYLPADTMLPLALANKVTNISVISADGSSTGVAYFVELE